MNQVERDACCCQRAFTHVQALAEVVGFEIKRDEVTSLKRLLDHDIATHIAKITELSDTASR